jgi:hypothetical protein
MLPHGLGGHESQSLNATPFASDGAVGSPDVRSDIGALTEKLHERRVDTRVRDATRGSKSFTGASKFAHGRRMRTALRTCWTSSGGWVGRGDDVFARLDSMVR